eukprot:CAMPEP_0114376780 /NCGR_PEP_ID=MMETSP0102-20121206/588_1 /TAXON_ID=38822 ORGANISM="Pteridomonas danica, Strain PT" /NCGR_SAMPLE_ID=MMETSP0102 /ASSEMBLY_ACC=CAM_ASM_000212 /LENGTH=829 /DNA_ID=CAMNT_0001531197 /DNA_START=301 /DNA_END=2791 /DNA_ORIENTATION=+
MTIRLEQVSALKKTEMKLKNEGAQTIAAVEKQSSNNQSSALKLPKLGAASQSRRAVKAAEDAAALAANKLKQAKDKNDKEYENYNILARKSQLAYEAERRKVLERIAIKETRAEAELSLSHNNETFELLNETTTKFEKNITTAKEKFKFEDGKVTHPNQLERTLLLEGQITCVTMSIGNVKDNTSDAYPGSWEGFWCNILHPVYFGRKSSSTIAGTISKSQKNKYGKGGTLVSSLKGKKALIPMIKSGKSIRDIYSGRRLIPDTSKGAKVGAMVLATPKINKLKPKFRKPDPADIYREADARYNKLISSGKGLVTGIDGQQHLTLAALTAMKQRDRAKKNVRMHDIKMNRKDQRDGKIKGPWNSRKRKKPKPITAVDLSRMEKRIEIEIKRKRKDRLKAMNDAKQKRALEAKKLKRRAKIETWLIKKLMDLDAEPELFREAMEAESKREKDEEIGMHGKNGKAMEVSSEELGRRANELRAKRVAKETSEYSAKELFRDIRRFFEKLSLDHRPHSRSIDNRVTESGVLATGEPIGGYIIEIPINRRSSNLYNNGNGVGGGKQAQKRGTVMKSRASVMKSRKSMISPQENIFDPLSNIVPLIGDDDCALSAFGVSPKIIDNDKDNNEYATAKGKGKAGGSKSSTPPIPTRGQARPEPLVHKRALLEALKEKDSLWLPRANAIKGLRPLMSMKVFEIAFLLHPVDAHKGHITAEELGIFTVAVHCVIDRYMRVRDRLAEIARKRQEEKSQYKLAAERRRLEEEAKAAIFEATRREALLKLQQDMVAARSDPHLADDAWSKFHVHIIVKPLDTQPAIVAHAVDENGKCYEMLV